MKRKPLPIDLTLFASPVLITERKEEFDELHAALTQELAPRGIVEKLFVAEIANIVWEMRRLRRSKTAISNIASKDAVKRILSGPARGFTDADREWADMVSKAASVGWFSHALIREEIIEGLKVRGLDESAIEAEIMRWVADDVEKLDRMIASLEMRFRKALRELADYRETFADRARIASNRLIEAPRVIELEKRRTKKAD
jgi:hypothetical protein